MLRSIRISSLASFVLSLALAAMAGCSPAAPAPSSGQSSLAPAATPQGASPTAVAPSAGSPSATPVSPAASGTGQPRQGGKLTIVMATNPPDLDAQQGISIDSHTATAPAYNRLVQFDVETSSKIVPDLAERWEVAKDGQSYTFYLREGVKFHDGTPLTTDDIAFNLQRLITPPQGLSTKAAPIIRPALQSIEKLDDRRVVMSLKFPLAPALSALALDSAIIYSKKMVEARGDMKTTIMGTGPFKMESYSPGVGVEFVKNPAYFVKGRPYLDRVSVRIINDPWTRLAALRTARVQMTGRGFSALPPSHMEALKTSIPNTQFYPSASPLGPAFFMNMRKPPFSDLRVRQAISLALDRQAAIKAVAEGQGEVGKVLLFGDWGVPVKEILTWPGWRQPKDADVAEAKKLLADAGYPDGFTITILSRPNNITRTASTFMTDQLQKIGIRSQVSVLEDAVFWETGRKGQHDAMVYTPGYSTPDPGSVISNFLVPGGSLNFTGYDDSKMTELNEAQMRALTEEDRRKAIRAAEERVLREQVTEIPIVWPYTFIALAAEVRGFIPGISDYVHNGNMLEGMWLAQ